MNEVAVRRNSAEEPFGVFAERLQGLLASHGLRRLRAQDACGTELVDAAGRRLVNFGANDYLGLAARGLSVTADACNRGAGASPLVCGYTSAHDALCQMLAELEQTEAAVLLPSGYAACCGVAATLPQADDLILSDQLNHASLIDGCRLSAADRRIYPHRDVQAVADLLRQHRSGYRHVWLLTEGVFGMDGALAPLEQLCDLVERYDAFLVVDEAHGTGVLGPDGMGACSHMGVKSRVPIRIGTLSKAIGAHGGFVVGPRVVIDYLINFCRPLIFSTAASPLVIQAAIAGVQAIGNEPSLRRRVASHAQRVRDSLGIASPAAERVIPIIPVQLGSNERALQASAEALAAGLAIPAIRPPTVPEGTARLRVSLSAAHTEQQIDGLIAYLKNL